MVLPFHSKMMGRAKHRHCRLRQRISLNMSSSFLVSTGGRPRASPDPGTAKPQGCHAMCEVASMTGYMRMAKAPK